MGNKKISLVLSGGGFKGAFQVGALEYLMYNPVFIENEVIDIDHFDIISGVSVGSLNGAMLATGQFEVLKDIWFNQILNQGSKVIYHSKYLEHGLPNTEKIIDELIPAFGLWDKIQLIFSKKKQGEFLQRIQENILALESFADNSPLRSILDQYISQDKFVDVQYKIGFVSLRDGNYKSLGQEEFPNDVELRKAILASSTIPTIWPPVPAIRTQKDEFYFDNVDGGIRNVSPLKDVIDAINARPNVGSEEHYIIVINCSTQHLPVIPANPSLVEIAVRSMLDITYSEIFKNDLEQFIWINNMLKAQNLQQLKIKNKTYRRFKIKIIQPSYSIGGTLDTDPQVILKWREMGYEMAEKETSSTDWNA
ncbi:patatin-like phospholipase family protein [Membranihabitans marinus]|uniref:patatin-like phospholipase family protein n=1 Tax=Membranihabitans marinus TaxID=1227546 RepID=UPI001F3BFBF2|nr:patatin-like phospholipase family protein [Membranihabitans marinus]